MSLKAKTWGDVFYAFLAKGHDHGSAAYEADRWERRMAARLTQGVHR